MAIYVKLSMLHGDYRKNYYEVNNHNIKCASKLKKKCVLANRNDVKINSGGNVYRLARLY